MGTKCMLKMVLRAAIWKPTPQPDLGSLPGLFLCVLAAFLASSLHEYAAAGASPRFMLYGINASLASLVVTLAAVAPFVRREGRIALLAAIMLLSAMADLGWAAIEFGKGLVSIETVKPGPWVSFVAPITWFVAFVVWWGGAVLVLLRSIEPDRRFALARSAMLWVALILVNAALPYEPIFRGRDFDIRTANYWEYVSALLNGSFERDKAPEPRRVNRAQVELAQPALLEAALSRLPAQVKGHADIYTLGIAGFSDQDVFTKELNGGLQALGKLLPIEDRIVRLVNHPDTAASMPAASRQNFAAAVHAIAGAMDKDEDVLLLFMTSHGSEDGVSLLLRGAFSVDLAPADVAAVLDREGIKNRIVIISACFSGIFVKPLINENTIVMTAADETHPSFGCSDTRDWTYFGDALFNRAVPAERTIEGAFREAKITIAHWEERDGLTSSNPQAHFGAALTAKLAPIYLPVQAAKASMTSARISAAAQ